jgi:hypothetical protein
MSFYGKIIVVQYHKEPITITEALKDTDLVHISQSINSMFLELWVNYQYHPIEEDTSERIIRLTLNYLQTGKDGFQPL